MENLIVLNFKSYSEALGENAVKLATISKEVAEETGVQIIAAPQTADLFSVSKIIPTYAQHIDPIELGSGTGAQLAESAKAAGATGSLLNHSEKPLTDELAKAGIEKLRTLGMKSLICSPDPARSETLATFNPDFIAVEPPELIGSGISVSSAKPEVVTQTVENIRNVNKNVAILCGAGIGTGADIHKALELGVSGVLLASAFTKATDPRAVLMDLAGGF